jgi:hypothetical protein
MRFTWGELKKFLEDNGVKDDMRINYIDVDGYEDLDRKPKLEDNNTTFSFCNS